MERLRKCAEEMGIKLTDEQLTMFQTYYEMMVETNKVMNLTAITEIDQVINKHFIDSISLVKVYPDLLSSDVSLNILDLGTGAGFPGIPLKIAFQNIKILLMDSLNKRVKFLKSVIDELDLADIDAVHGRAEEMARKTEYREQFDLCVSRAVANLSTLSEYCLPFVKVSGKLISYKASDIDEEIRSASNAINILGGNLTEVKKIIVPGSEIERSFIIIDKTGKTPKTYPRKAGTASKKPL